MRADEQIVVRVPGRVNLIGDHTDYTGGLVLPTVVDSYTTITGRFTDRNEWHLVSETHGEVTIPLDQARALAIDVDWARYPAGVISEMLRIGLAVRGFDGTVATSLPIGGGLSSSAAFEIATARVAIASTRAADVVLDDLELAQLCQRAENVATGVPCGIMDQLSIVSGQRGWATMIDCSTFDVTLVPIPDEVRVEHRFIAQRALAESEYGERVAQCRAIEEMIGPLHQATEHDVERIESELLRRRARHVVTENGRVRAFAVALSDHRFDEAGRLMTESHHSLSRDYATSTPVMDAAVESLLCEPDVLGARMTGGGFGGCVVILRRA